MKNYIFNRSVCFIESKIRFEINDSNIHNYVDLSHSLLGCFNCIIDLYICYAPSDEVDSPARCINVRTKGDSKSHI